MFCENCGTKLEDGTVFCTNCGAKQSSAEAAPAQQAAPTQTGAPVAPAAPKSNPFKKVPVWGWIIIVVVIAGLAVGGFFLNQKMHTVDLNDYLTVKFDGYDTVGTATIEIDDEFYEKVFEKAKYKHKKDDEDDASIHYTEGDMMRDYLYDYISVELDDYDHLTNGDEVKVSVKVKADKIKKKYGVTITGKDQKFTVEDLKEVETFNPFDDVEITFAGISGDGRINVEIVNDREVYDDFSFYCEDDYYIEEGDTVTVEFAPYYDEDELTEYCAEEYGMIPTTKEMEITAEGLGSYVEDANEIKDLGDLGDECVTAIKDELDDAYYGYDISYGDISYLGSYVVSTGYGNEVFAVYNVNCDVTVDDDVASLSFYTYVEADSVVVNGDGLVTDYYLYSTTYNTCYFEIGGYTYGVYGYETLDDLADDMSYYESYYDVTNNVSTGV